ncbi:hypothetical protein SB748_25305 [Rhizobium sp. SIMBA_035]
MNSTMFVPEKRIEVQARSEMKVEQAVLIVPLAQAIAVDALAAEAKVFKDHSFRRQAVRREQEPGKDERPGTS